MWPAPSWCQFADLEIFFRIKRLQMFFRPDWFYLTVQSPRSLCVCVCPWSVCQCPRFTVPFTKPSFRACLSLSHPLPHISGQPAAQQSAEGFPAPPTSSAGCRGASGAHLPVSLTSFWAQKQQVAFLTWSGPCPCTLLLCQQPPRSRPPQQHSGSLQP